MGGRYGKNKRKSKLSTTALCASLFSLGLLSTANAALEPRLGGAAYYDTDLNITWAADANINGMHNWWDQMAWASGLTIDGISGWYLAGLGEMEHLYYAEGVTYFSPGPFSHVEYYYWTSSLELGYPIVFAYYFSMGEDWVDSTDKVNSFSAWPIHSGDVALIPEPQTYAMLLAGLGLLGFGQLQRRREYLDDSSH
ncbi:MAG: PEP-CTERM sorting domain-containing protein [Nitrosomonadaceae bacterium]|nr:PEP-CTERM sorting domain-containing protein [Nitrosomonadaceae bacterium]